MTLLRRQLRVLIADDTAIVRTVVTRILRSDERFDVVGEATNGREAVEHATAMHPDLVLLDLAMPEMDGLEALPLIRQISPAPNVIVLSAFSPDQMAAAAIDAGALAYLEKNQLATKLIPRILEAFEDALLDAQA
ncbi:MAG TPA: response regulator [Acidimicrobiales bacterium]|nr:response regulator [Acidimicrobiales bacterium]